MSLKKKLKNYLVWKRQRLAFAELVRTHPLRYLFFEVTRRCNLSCRYCGSSCTPKELADELTSDEWIDVARQVAHDFPAKQVMIAVTGGEPLLKPGIFDIYRELTRLGFRFGMVTNATLLDRETARELVDTGIGSISISMDALPDINDSLRGKGTSEKIRQGIANLHAVGYGGKLEIISTITKPAVRTLDQMRKLVAQLRVPLWRVAPVIPIGRAAEHPELLPDAVDNRAILEYVKATRLDGLIPKPEFSEEGFLGYRFEGTVRPYLAQCRAGISIAGIRATGIIGACPELAPVFDQGDIRKERFKDVWEHKYENLRDRSWTKREPCNSCAHYADCRGGAMHLYPNTDAPFIRCLYLQCKQAETILAARAQARGIPPEARGWADGTASGASTDGTTAP